jgi:hypothetical protein
MTCDPRRETAVSLAKHFLSFSLFSGLLGARTKWARRAPHLGRTRDRHATPTAGEAIQRERRAPAAPGSPCRAGALLAMTIRRRLGTRRLKVAVRKSRAAAQVEHRTGRLHEPHPEWDTCGAVAQLGGFAAAEASFEGPLGRPGGQRLSVAAAQKRSQGLEMSRSRKLARGALRSHWRWLNSGSRRG